MDVHGLFIAVYFGIPRSADLKAVADPTCCKTIAIHIYSIVDGGNCVVH